MKGARSEEEEEDREEEAAGMSVSDAFVAECGRVNDDVDRDRDDDVIVSSRVRLASASRLLGDSARLKAKCPFEPALAVTPAPGVEDDEAVDGP